MEALVNEQVGETTLHITLRNTNRCCGFWELDFNGAVDVKNAVRCVHGYLYKHTYYEGETGRYRSCPGPIEAATKVPPLKPAFKELFEDVKLTENHGHKGIKGAGMVFVNLKIKTPSGEGPTQEKLIPLVEKLGFKAVEDYYNPRSKCTLRLFLATGKEIAEKLGI